MIDDCSIMMMTRMPTWHCSVDNVSRVGHEQRACDKREDSKTQAKTIP